MKFLGRIISLFLSNAVALLAAAYFVPGFQISYDFVSFLKLAAALTVFNVFIKPLFTIILSPVIIITFGLGIIFINAAILYALDFFSDAIKIEGLIPLLYATIIISITNIITHFIFKRFKD